MDKNNKKPNDFKSKPGIKYPDDDNKPSTSGYNNRYQDKNLRDPKRTETQKRSRSPDERIRDCNLVDRKKVKVKNEESIKIENENQSNFSSDNQFPHQQSLPQQVQQIPQMPQINYSNYGYNGPEHYNVEPNQRNFPMMAPYNMYGAMNTQWPCNQVDPMCMPSNNMPVNAVPLPVSTGMDMASNVNGNINGYNPYMPMGIYDGNMMGINNWAPYPMYAHDNVPAPPIKEKITLTNCVLYPPHPGTQIRSRVRHPGCRTVFVGGLPENITEELIREIFGRCGEISTVRMSKKNFCHIRFASMEFVDLAMMLSGYRLKIGDQDDSANSGRIHVDYAKARDDDHDWKCIQRARQQKIRFRERLEQEAARPPTPPPVVHYSEHEASLLSDRLKNEETLKDAIHVLVTWLNRGECNRKTCGNFYSMIQCTNSHVKRLINEANKLEEELNKAKRSLQDKMSAISLQFYKISRLFELIQEENVWENFSNSQKKSIETMKQATLDIVVAHSREVVAERVEEEMELSDDDCAAENPHDSRAVQNIRKREEIEKIKAEIVVARNRLQAALEETVAIQREKEKNNSIHNTLMHERKKELEAKVVERDRLHKIKEECLATHSQNEIEDSNESEKKENQTLIFRTIKVC